VLILLISALSFTCALQRMYERAWQLEARGMRAAPWGLLWLAYLTLYLVLHPALHDQVSGAVGLVGSIAGAIVLYLLTPSVLLGRRLPWRLLLPQAALSAVGMAALRGGSAVYMPYALCSRRRSC
jgi:membrane protein